LQLFPFSHATFIKIKHFGLAQNFFAPHQKPLGKRLGVRWRIPRVDTLKSANSARTENAHKLRRKTFLFCFVTIICTITGGRNRYGLVWAVMIRHLNCPLTTYFKKTFQG